MDKPPKQTDKGAEGGALVCIRSPPSDHHKRTAVVVERVSVIRTLTWPLMEDRTAWFIRHTSS